MVKIYEECLQTFCLIFLGAGIMRMHYHLCLLKSNLNYNDISDQRCLGLLMLTACHKSILFTIYQAGFSHTLEQDSSQEQLYKHLFHIWWPVFDSPLFISKKLMPYMCTYVIHMCVCVGLYRPSLGIHRELVSENLSDTKIQKSQVSYRK